MMLLAGVALAYAGANSTFFPGGQTYTQSQLTTLFQGSSNSYISSNASSFASMSYNVESGGATNINSGVNGQVACCTGLMQMSADNLRAPSICGCTAQEFATYSGDKQIDVYTKFYNQNQNSSTMRQLNQMEANGQTLGGVPVDANTKIACAQFGPKVCQANISSDCKSGGDGNGQSICAIASKARANDQGSGSGSDASKGKDNNKDNASGCTTPTDPKAASTPGNIGAGDGSSNSTATAGTTGGADATRTGGGTSDGSTGSSSGSATTSGTPETASKSVPCKSAESKATDKTSKTCQPTMKMINELQCSNFPSSVQAFCQQYKPKLMTSDECTRAEKMAEKAQKGQRQTECENQTFATPGTSAWSYVLACSFTQKNQGTYGSATQSSNGSTGSSSGGSSSGGGGSTSGDGNPDDPQCIERLKKRIPDLKSLGGVTSNGNGTTCGMKSGVSTSNLGGIPITPTVTAECLEMEKLADFADQMKGKGVTRLENIGSLDRTCRPKRNASGTHYGTVSSHAWGMAVDVSGFYLGGQFMNTKKYWSDSSTKAWMDSNVRPTACSIFKGVLGPYFYRGAYSHFHVEMKQKTRCDPGN